MQKPDTKTTDQNSKTEFQNRVYLYTLKSLKFLGSINIIEAKASNSKKDFARYFDIAFKSANETKYWLHLLKDLDKVDKTKIQEIINETRELSNILALSLLTMRKRKNI